MVILKDENNRDKMNFLLPLTVFALCVLIFAASFFLRPFILLDASGQSALFKEFISELKKGNTGNLGEYIVSEGEFKGFDFDDRLLDLLLKKNIESLGYSERDAFRTKDGSGIVINISAEYLDIKKIMRDSADGLEKLIRKKLDSENESKELFDQSGAHNEGYIKAQLNNIILNNLDSGNYKIVTQAAIRFKKDGEDWKIVMNKELADIILGLA